MKKFITTLLIIALLGTVGCAGQLRETAMASNEIADRLNHESVEDLYAMTVKQGMALAKAQIKVAIADGTANDPVTFTHNNGKEYTMAKVDYIINNVSQTLVNAAWLKNNHTKAQHYSDMAWIYMASRESFLSVLARDIKKAWENSESEEDKTDFSPTE